MVKSKGKRPAQGPQGPSKRRKLSTSHSSKPKAPRTAAKSKGKERASDKPIIPIPTFPNDEGDIEKLSDDDVEAFNSFGPAAAFLDRLDEKGIARSKKETIRLHKSNKPARVVTRDDTFPPVDSHSENEESWSSVDTDTESIADDRGPTFSDCDVEMPYESLPRQNHAPWEFDQDLGVERLPIKLSDGQIQKTGVKFLISRSDPDESEDDEDIHVEEEDTFKVEDVSTGSRFGRRSVIEIVSIPSRKARVHDAKEQIASISQDILSDPENNLGLLRRLNTFCMPEISSNFHPEPVANDVIIRKLAILSQVAVFKDIIPGYRIRTLTDKEKAEKVSQAVARTREWEQGLVGVYHQYLRILESELKAMSDLADTALQCMCMLLVEVTHFNFRTNLIGCIVSRLSRRSWNKSSDTCLNALITVLRKDTAGGPSLEVVRLLNRMIKEKKYNVNPEVLSCLLHLRLKTELGIRASETRADQEVESKPHSDNKAAARRAKGKSTDKPHLSKKAKKVLKERKEIQKEMREAEVDVDKEERDSTQTETLKLVFVLYFSIIKNPRHGPLLPSALQGISKFAHLVNIDFFRDLLTALKGIAPLDSSRAHDDIGVENVPPPIYLCLLCISTAFDLLSGQGEALNIDLNDFINDLYSIIPSLSASPEIDRSPTRPQSNITAAPQLQSPSDLLFRTLHLVFSPRVSASVSPAWRSAAFAKRLLTAALHWPSRTALRAIEFVGRLVAKENKLFGLLSTEDRLVDGIYRPDLDDPQLSQPFGTCFWELCVLQNAHYDKEVREAARKLLFTPI